MQLAECEIEVSVILPCRDEEKSIGSCIALINKVFLERHIKGEIIVSDSSVDKSPEIAKEYKVVLVKHDREGYGRAYLEGIKKAKGKYIFMADADCSYDFNEIPRFINVLKQGNDLVIGNRFKGRIKKGAMPWLHRYIGNPLLSFLFSIFFKSKIGDIHCGMRAISREAFALLKLQTLGMEFASEMIIKANKNNFKIKELPINYYPRTGKSKLKSFSDGWKHLRFMLLYSPIFLFLIPGIILSLLGIFSMLWLYFSNPEILGIKLFYHPMFVSSLLIIIGYQIIIFAIFAKTYAIIHLDEEGKKMNALYKYVTIERASLLGVLISFFGAIIYILIFLKWIKSGFGALEEVKTSIIALTLIIIGIQTIFSSFMLSILGIQEK